MHCSLQTLKIIGFKHWSVQKKKKKKRSAKCPLEHIFTVFKVPFLQQEKKGVAEARNWFIVCFS